MASEIAFVCVAKRHGAPKGAARGAVTIHQGLWAFCEGSTPGDHDWQPTGGVPLEQLLARRIVLRESAARV